MKSLFAFGHRLGYLPFDVGRVVKRPKRKDTLAERILSEGDVPKLLVTAGQQPTRKRTAAQEQRARRNYVLLRLLYAGGLRVEEIADLVGPMLNGSLGDLIHKMQQGNTYVNFHTAKFPDGEGRGQLLDVSVMQTEQTLWGWLLRNNPTSSSAGTVHGIAGYWGQGISQLAQMSELADPPPVPPGRRPAWQ